VNHENRWKFLGSKRRGSDLMSSHELWHDDNCYEMKYCGPDDSDGYREYNGLPVDLVFEILAVWELNQATYWELRKKIMSILGSHFARSVSLQQKEAVSALVVEMTNRR